MNLEHFIILKLWLLYIVQCTICTYSRQSSLQEKNHFHGDLKNTTNRSLNTGYGILFFKSLEKFCQRLRENKIFYPSYKTVLGLSCSTVHISQIWFVRKSTNAEVLLPPPVIFNILINLWFNAVRNVPAAKFIPIGPIIYCPAAWNIVPGKEKCLL
jgi:hypothetical protein